ncbi:hypothetical protein C1701_14625 [Actinoalloteichus sp. AHMU CJ021]|nr:hypothetical protein C1701_14625 [Actinoalloteichus sp. AHMU CJ021]
MAGEVAQAGCGSPSGLGVHPSDQAAGDDRSWQHFRSWEYFAVWAERVPAPRRPAPLAPVLRGRPLRSDAEDPVR